MSEDMLGRMLGFRQGSERKPRGLFNRQKDMSPGGDIGLTRGQEIVFGSDPKFQKKRLGDATLIRLKPGVVDKRQLSRVAVAIAMDSEGKSISVGSLTDNNTVHVWYKNAPSDVDWRRRKLGSKSPAMVFKKGRNMPIIDVRTADGTLLRLSESGGGGDNDGMTNRSFRLRINPKERDVNKLK